MPVNLPDPLEAATTEASWLVPILPMMTDVDRVMADVPWAKKEVLFAGLEAFHAERMSKTPSTTKYPEAGVWVKQVIEVDKHLQQLANMTSLQMAIYRSMGPFLTYRGFNNAARHVSMVEKCRIAYLPETDRGQLHIKNVDDPIQHWKPDPKPLEALYAGAELMNNGVGSGLHMDDEPDELFPLNPIKMMYSYCNDVPSAVEFLTRYSKFWGGGNLLLQDKQKRSVGIEKCSVNFIEVFYPGPDGRSHVSGLACRDPNSPLGKHQRKMRDKYLKAFSLPRDGTDNTYWHFCDLFEQKLSKGIKDLGPKAKSDEVVHLFKDEWPKGLNKPGIKAHPDIAAEDYTLAVFASFLDEKRTYRWQRSRNGKSFPSEPEVFQF